MMAPMVTVMFFLIAGSHRCHADITEINLPFDASDFAIHAKSGDIAALDPDREKVVLFRRTNLEKGSSGEGTELRVGPTASSICFKQFQGQSFYVVVCTRDSHVYVIDADKFELKKKIPTSGEGISNVYCSLNPQDPFVYYNYGSGHGSVAAAIDLRSMSDRGKIFDSAMDSAVSANGLYAYRRGRTARAVTLKT